jgi:hypothetical protein
MRKLLVSLVIGVFLAATTVVLAQGDKSPLPKDKVGLGVKIGATGGNGISAAYAIQENVHIGSGIGLGFATETSETASDGGVILNFNPFFRYIMTNEANLFPYVEVNFMFTENPGLGGTRSSSTANVQLGGFWFPFSTVSVRGGVTSLFFDIDTSQLGIGALGPFIGIDWWM